VLRSRVLQRAFRRPGLLDLDQRNMVDRT